MCCCFAAATLLTNRACPLRCGDVLLLLFSANDKRPLLCPLVRGDCACACGMWPCGDVLNSDSGDTGDDYCDARKFVCASLITIYVCKCAVR